MKKTPFSTTLEFDSLPRVGANRHAGRARALQRLGIALAGFWLVVAAALVGLVL